MTQIAPFNIAEAAASASYTRLALEVGTEFSIEPGKKFRIVKLNHSGGFGSGAESGTLAAGLKLFEWVDQTLYTVKPANAATDRPAGVTASGTPNLADGDLFAVQIEGIVTVTTASDGALVAGDQVVGDDDTDLGKVTGAGNTTETQATIGIALESQASGDSTARVRLNRKL